MVREGPCVNPQCPDPDNPSGRWTYVPAQFCEECDDVLLEHLVSCVCKKPACRRWCKLADEKKPGRKPTLAELPLQAGYATSMPMRAGCPPIIEDVIEVWAAR